MKISKADAVWTGNLPQGKGNMHLGSGAFEGAYTFQSRFENGAGTNPEELIGAAEAGCFSMALSSALGKAGFTPNRIQTNAQVTMDNVNGQNSISRIDLDCQADIPGIDNQKFQELADGAKKNCPVSRALSGVEVTLKAKLVK